MKNNTYSTIKSLSVSKVLFKTFSAWQQNLQYFNPVNISISQPSQGEAFALRRLVETRRPAAQNFPSQHRLRGVVRRSLQQEGSVHRPLRSHGGALGEQLGKVRNFCFCRHDADDLLRWRHRFWFQPLEGVRQSRFGVGAFFHGNQFGFSYFVVLKIPPLHYFADCWFLGICWLMWAGEYCDVWRYCDVT